MLAFGQGETQGILTVVATLIAGRKPIRNVT